VAISAQLVTPSAAFAQNSGAQNAPTILYSLPNGLTVVLEEDHRQKVVALRTIRRTWRLW
jgi:predicted Zn-dependent peptidase